MTLGLYLHIPFCRSKCLYCDFCSLPHPPAATVDAYVRVLCLDLCRRAPLAKGRRVDTVYLGGGTPTFLSGAQLESILLAVKEHYALTPDAEITAECNPATADEKKLRRMRRAGVNRLSIGLQSIHENELRALGRIHTVKAFDDILRDARRAGFENISADVMSGIPEQTLQSYLATLSYLCERDLTHVSAYGLIIEEGTPFARCADRLPLPDEETAREMYLRGAELLERAGRRQYEISNFCAEGFASRHNLRYWNAEEFLGFGPAAYSDFGGRRFGYAGDLSSYLAGKETLESDETPTPEARRDEYLMLRMRLTEGVSLSVFAERFGEAAAQGFSERIERYLPLGLVRRTREGYAFTREGMYVSNSILSEILCF